MEETNKDLLDWLEAQIFGDAPPVDVVERAPDLTPADAFRLRHALVQRRVSKGDRHIGYKVAGASRTIQAQEHVEGPQVGTLMASGLYSEGVSIAIGGYGRVGLEAEVGVLMKHDLAGPHVTMSDVMLAAEAVFPAFEIVASRFAGKRSRAMRIINSKFGGGIVVGHPMTSPLGIDLRLEGMVLTVNNEVSGSATGVEILGNPLNAVALVANTICEFGLRLEAGMIVMTGSFLGNTSIKPGDRVRATYTRLGSVAASFS